MMERKKVLIFARDLAGGGLESFIATLVPHVDPDRLDVKVLVICSSGPFLRCVEPWLLDPGATWAGRITQRVLGKAFERKALYHALLVLLLPLIAVHVNLTVRRERPDVVMTCSALWTGMYFISGALIGRRYAWIVREGSNIATGLEQMPIAYRTLLRFFVRFAGRRADRVIVASKGCKPAFMKAFGIRAADITIIPNPVDLGAAERASRAVHPGERRDLAFVGRLEPVKNVDVLIRAFHDSGLQHEGHRLLVYGTGSQRTVLGELAVDLGIEEFVLFPGFADNRFEAIARSRVLVLASSREGFGNVVLEAMAVGTPVVVSDCPFGPSELVQDGRCGVVVATNSVEDLRDGLVRIMRDPELSSSNAERARLRASGYDAVQIVRRYEGALTARPARRPDWASRSATGVRGSWTGPSR